MEDSRLRILNLLQRQNRATVEQLSRQMDLASATVRRHLDILQRDNLVSFERVKKRTGRPEYAYYLTEAGQEALPKDYAQLLERLLQQLSSLPEAEAGEPSGQAVLGRAFESLAVTTATEAGPGIDEPFSQRLAKAKAFLEKGKYEPEVEEYNGSIRIYLRNCPFRQVALSNDSVCRYDGLLLSLLLGTEVVQEHTVRDSSSCCCYRIAKAV